MHEAGLVRPAQSWFVVCATSTLSVAVDAELAAADAVAVADGRAESVSAWEKQTLADKAAKDRRLTALAVAVAAYEADHGVTGIRRDSLRSGEAAAAAKHD